MACPSAVVPKGWWPGGVRHQEPPQAYGEEEAPQAAEEDAYPAQEQEVAARGRRGACGCARSVPAASCPRQGRGLPLVSHGALRSHGGPEGRAADRCASGLIRVTRR